MCKTIELRDQIAMNVMDRLLEDGGARSAEEVARDAYMMADAMMAARTPTVAVNLNGDSVTVNDGEAARKALAEFNRNRGYRGYPL